MIFTAMKWSWACIGCFARKWKTDPSPSNLRLALEVYGESNFSLYGKRNSPHDSREAPLSVQAFAHVQNGCFIPFSGKLLPRRCFRRKLAQISLASLLFSSKSGNRIPRAPLINCNLTSQMNHSLICSTPILMMVLMWSSCRE